MKLGAALLFFAALTQAKVPIEGKAEASESNHEMRLALKKDPESGKKLG